MKKFLVMAVFGLAGLAAFAGTCVVTRISLVSTDGTHKTFAGQLDNTSGVNILQHNFVVAFLDSGNNVLETKSVSGCLRSIPNGSSDYFSAVSISAASVVSTGLARVAFDSTFRVGTTSSQNVSLTNVTANRNTTVTPSTLTVGGKITNNSGTALISPNVCIVVRTSLGNVLITATTSTGDIAASGSTTFTSTITVPNDSTASTVDIWVDGLDSSSNPTTPQSFLGYTVTTGGTATKLSFSTQPVGGVAINTNFGTMPVVSILDVNNAVVTTGTDATKVVTLSILASSVPASPVTTLTCTSGLSVTAVAGIAAFTGCQVNHADPNIQLTASASSLPSINSATFGINPGAATALAFAPGTPAGAVSQVAFTTQPVVNVVDANGDIVWTGTNSNASITLTLTGAPGTGALAGCTAAVPAVAGVATFTTCSVNLSGSKTLTATTTGLTTNTATSASFIVSPGAATKLAINQPSGAGTGVIFTPTQPIVTVQDAAGNTVTTSTASITLTSSGGTLACTANPVAAVGGIATFAGCKITGAGSWTITAASAPLTSATTAAPIVITP